MDNIKIVPCDKSCYDQLYKIHLSVMPENDIMTENCFFDEFVQATRKYFVAINNNCAIGYIGVFDSFDDYNIIGIAVEEGYQRRGIGYKLLQRIIEEAKKNNIKTISLEVDETNEKAINFYKKNGFVVTNIRKKYYKDNDALIMWLYL